MKARKRHSSDKRLRGCITDIAALVPRTSAAATAPRVMVLLAFILELSFVARALRTAFRGAADLRVDHSATARAPRRTSQLRVHVA
jgi:hypothetical protein